MPDCERRVVSRALEVRADIDVLSTLTGYAAIFDSEAEIAGLFREVIRPGAFTAAVSRDDVRALFNHDPNFVIGRTSAGTLRLDEDASGLRYDVTPPDTSWARDLMVSVQRGDISQSSFGFSVTRDQWHQPSTRAGLPLREILEVSLYDVSPVAFPAYDATSVSARDRASAFVHPSPDVRADIDRRRMDLRRRELALKGR